jgi:hypothetical protein
MKSPTHALESQLEYNYTTRAQLTNSQVTKNSPKLKPTQATQVTECMPAASACVRSVWPSRACSASLYWVLSE